MTTDANTTPASATPPINPKYPLSGLTVEETDLLEREGWHEMNFESCPPPWGLRAGGARWSPRDALAACRFAVARGLLSAELVALQRFLGGTEADPDATIDPSAIDAIMMSSHLASRFAPSYLTAMSAAVDAYAARDHAKVIALVEGVASAPEPVASPLDLDAVLREIAKTGVEVRFRVPEGDVSVYRISSDKAIVGNGSTLEVAVRDLARQCLAHRAKERDAMFAHFDAAEKRRTALASLLGDTAETPSP